MHAWVNVNLVSEAEPPAARSHIVYTHPEWLMVPRPLAADLAQMNPRNPEYLRRLSEYAKGPQRSRRRRVPLPHPQGRGRAHRAGDWRYRVPLRTWTASTSTTSAFQTTSSTTAPRRSRRFDRPWSSKASSAERREYSERARGRPLFYTEMFPQRWQEFRRARLTALLTRIRSTVKARRPRAVLSAAVFPDATDADRHDVFRIGATGSKTGLLDAICPMAYTTDPAVFRTQVANVEQLAGSRPVWAGIGAYQLSPAATIENIRAARQLGAEGIILFSYDNLNGSYVDDRRQCRVSLAPQKSSSAGTTSARIQPRSWRLGHPTASLWQQAFGRLDYDPDARLAHTDTIFDLASLTKVIATTSLDDAACRSGARSLWATALRTGFPNGGARIAMASRSVRS